MKQKISDSGKTISIMLPNETVLLSFLFLWIAAGLFLFFIKKIFFSLEVVWKLEILKLWNSSILSILLEVRAVWVLDIVNIVIEGSQDEYEKKKKGCHR